ncbi:hypothetical protein VTL71DRAFT_10364 [Oculimacula yallundae]|uniref:2EXR domain-containing protein n=1 Tax=Oculimacula yallundae TaxID=86028 RepID=A0ABR4CSW0_9HELO
MSTQVLSDLFGRLSLTDNSTIIPTIFPRFRNLPTELRLKIWRFTLPGPRVIGIRTGQQGRYCIAMNNQDLALENLLEACPESKEVVLKHYKYCFKVNIGRPILFSGKKDILRFYCLDALDQFFTLSSGPIGADIATVRTIAIGAPRYRPQRLSLLQSLSMLPELIALAWLRFGRLSEVIRLPFSTYPDTDWWEGRTNRVRRSFEKISLRDFKLSRDQFVLERKKASGISPADENPRVNIRFMWCRDFALRGTEVLLREDQTCFCDDTSADYCYFHKTWRVISAEERVRRNPFSNPVMPRQPHRFS